MMRRVGYCAAVSIFPSQIHSFVVSWPTCGTEGIWIEEVLGLFIEEREPSKAQLGHLSILTQ